MTRFNPFLFTRAPLVVAALLAGCAGAPSGEARPTDAAQVAPAPSPSRDPSRAPSAVARQTFEALSPAIR